MKINNSNVKNNSKTLKIHFNIVFISGNDISDVSFM